MRRKRIIKKPEPEITLAEMRARRREIEESQEKRVHRRYSDNEVGRALRASGGFRTRAAELLGITPSAITQRLKKSKFLKKIMDEVLEKNLDLAEKKLIEGIESA